MLTLTTKIILMVLTIIAWIATSIWLIKLRKNSASTKDTDAVSYDDDIMDP